MNLGVMIGWNGVKRAKKCGDFARATSGMIPPNALECQVHGDGGPSSSKS